MCNVITAAIFLAINMQFWSMLPLVVPQSYGFVERKKSCKIDHMYLKGNASLSSISFFHFIIFEKKLEDISPVCGTTDTPVLDF